MNTEDKIIELLRKNRIGEEKAVYLAHELLLLLSDKRQSEQLVCECCEDNLVEEQGDWCQECLDKPSRVITN